MAMALFGTKKVAEGVAEHAEEVVEEGIEDAAQDMFLDFIPGVGGLVAAKKARDRYRRDPVVVRANNQIEALQGQINQLEQQKAHLFWGSVGVYGVACFLIIAISSGVNNYSPRTVPTARVSRPAVQAPRPVAASTGALLPERPAPELVKKRTTRKRRSRKKARRKVGSRSNAKRHARGTRQKKKGKKRRRPAADSPVDPFATTLKKEPRPAADDPVNPF